MEKVEEKQKKNTNKILNNPTTTTTITQISKPTKTIITQKLPSSQLQYSYHKQKPFFFLVIWLCLYFLEVIYF